MEENVFSPTSQGDFFLFVGNMASENWPLTSLSLFPLSHSLPLSFCRSTAPCPHSFRPSPRDSQLQSPSLINYAFHGGRVQIWEVTNHRTGTTLAERGVGWARGGCRSPNPPSPPPHPPHPPSLDSIKWPSSPTSSLRITRGVGVHLAAEAVLTMKACQFTSKHTLKQGSRI